jgi:4-alpha-glucanotransferase
MSDSLLRELAQAAGVAPSWRDAFGAMQEVAPDTLRHVLAALDVPAQSEAALRDSLARLRAPQLQDQLPPLLTADIGQSLTLAAPQARLRITLESGEIIEQAAGEAGTPVRLPAIDRAGYHQLDLGELQATLAVAPARCFGVRDADPAGRLWGLAAQLYALRRAGDGGIGDFTALADFARNAARAGADALAISPIHAQFSADPDRFSPYSPSSRVQLNVLHADVDALLAGTPDADAARFEALPLVDWPGASRARLARFRAAYAAFAAAPAHPLAEAFAQFRRQQGEALECHARFEALHQHLFGADPNLWNWRTWPVALRDPASPAVSEFAAAHADEVRFHAFMQFIADRGLSAAQAAAREAGMKIGLISDLAVGTDGGGSHAWARQDETLIGLSIGAPPDILSRRGQDWGLAAFSPTGLARHGFSAYLEMLRGALRHAGGVRIDHVMGLSRLWVLPEGATAAEGAYLNYPLADLLRLIALESQRYRCVILGEDLGTVPDGFQQQLDQRTLLGLRVLWFEMEGERFRPPSHWTRDAAAMTSTHDLATVAGWWSGHDLDQSRDLGMLGDENGVWFAYQNRARDRDRLWGALCDSGAASGEKPDDAAPLPVVDAAIRHVGGSNCDLALLPTEDALATRDQPNLPGTTDQHPNWRRRLALEADEFFADPHIAARLRLMDEARKPHES